MTTLTQQVSSLARVLWDYHTFSPQLRRSDFLLALGSQDEGVAVHAASLFRDGWAPLLVVSGGFGKVTHDLWHQTEAERFAAVASANDVPTEAILIEPKATNTGENLTLTRELLASQGRNVGSGILVCKPYMKRRSYATACKQWPEVRWSVSSEDITFDDYVARARSPENTVNLLTGDLERIRLYAEMGFQITQHIPDDVWSAYESLVHLGFDRYVIRDTT